MAEHDAALAALPDPKVRALLAHLHRRGFESAMLAMNEGTEFSVERPPAGLGGDAVRARGASCAS